MLGPAGGDPCAPALGSVRSSPYGDDRSLTTRTPVTEAGSADRGPTVVIGLEHQRLRASDVKEAS